MSEQAAQAQCVITADCNGITYQDKECEGKDEWTLRKGAEGTTAKGFDSSNSQSRQLDRSTCKATTLALVEIVADPPTTTDKTESPHSKVKVLEPNMPPLSTDIAEESPKHEALDKADESKMVSKWTKPEEKPEEKQAKEAAAATSSAVERMVQLSLDALKYVSRPNADKNKSEKFGE